MVVVLNQDLTVWKKQVFYSFLSETNKANEVKYEKKDKQAKVALWKDYYENCKKDDGGDRKKETNERFEAKVFRRHEVFSVDRLSFYFLLLFLLFIIEFNRNLLDFNLGSRFVLGLSYIFICSNMLFWSLKNNSGLDFFGTYWNVIIALCVNVFSSKLRQLDFLGLIMFVKGKFASPLFELFWRRTFKGIH